MHPITRSLYLLFFLLCTINPVCSFADSLDVFEATHLLSINQGTSNSSYIRSLGRGGFELSHGEPVALSGWYRSNWTDSSIEFLTQANDHFGILWGFTTGETAEKYRINPSIKLGFVYKNTVSQHSVIEARFSTILGGYLKEKSCTADYGDIGGVQQVNCRMAATNLPPEQTLKYLMNERPVDFVSIFVQYRHSF
jgi:hypothetical protein